MKLSDIVIGGIVVIKTDDELSHLDFYSIERIEIDNNMEFFAVCKSLHSEENRTFNVSELKNPKEYGY